jgi:hypothetical protein
MPALGKKRFVAFYANRVGRRSASPPAPQEARDLRLRFDRQAGSLPSGKKRCGGMSPLKGRSAPDSRSGLGSGQAPDWRWERSRRGEPATGSEEGGVGAPRQELGVDPSEGLRASRASERPTTTRVGRPAEDAGQAATWRTRRPAKIWFCKGEDVSPEGLTRQSVLLGDAHRRGPVG